MSTALAIASVTYVLKDLLNNGLIDHDVSSAVGNVVVTTLPPELRRSVASIMPLYVLPQREKERPGADPLKRWFKITLTPEAEVKPFIEGLRRLDSVEAVDRALAPTPPP